MATDKIMKFNIDHDDLTAVEKELKSILKLIYQIEAVAGKSWLLRILFGLKRKAGKNGKV
jgi:hypothetical protein